MNKVYKFPEMLKQLLKEKKWSQRQLAEMIDYSEESVYKWANYKAMPTVFVVMELASIFNVSVDYLLYGKRS